MKKNQLLRQVRWSFRKRKIKQTLSNRYGIEGHIPDRLLDKPDYKMSISEFKNFHLVHSIIVGETAQQINAELEQKHMEAILNAIRNNLPDVPLEYLEKICYRHLKYKTDKHYRTILIYLEKNSLRWRGGCILPKKGG